VNSNKSHKSKLTIVFFLNENIEITIKIKKVNIGIVSTGVNLKTPVHDNTIKYKAKKKLMRKLPFKLAPYFTFKSINILHYEYKVINEFKV